MTKQSRKKGSRTYHLTPRLLELHESGELCPFTKLQGIDEIAWAFQWSRSKTEGKLQQLQSDGVVFKDSMGGVFTTIYCSYLELILRYVSLCGKEGKHIWSNRITVTLFYNYTVQHPGEGITD